MQKDDYKIHSIAEIKVQVEELFKNKLNQNDRKIIFQTGKGGVLLYLESIFNSSDATPMTPERKQELSDKYLDGLYTIKDGDISSPIFSDEDRADGLYIFHRWAREDSEGNRYGDKYLLENWEAGWGYIIRELTEEEFNQAKK